jgi:hypothetical protein
MTVAVQTRFAQAISGDSNEFSSDRERDGARLGTERLCEYAHAFAREIPL